MVGVASNYIAANEKGPATASAEVAFAVAEHMHHRLYALHPHVPQLGRVH